MMMGASILNIGKKLITQVFFTDMLAWSKTLKSTCTIEEDKTTNGEWTNQPTTQPTNQQTSNRRNTYEVVMNAQPVS